MKQHSTPVIIRHDKATCLERILLNSELYNEAWIQDICFQNESILPVNEIEPVFNGMIPICKELSTESGAIDLIFLNEFGFITICECKLWRNPDARRSVIGQILDYGKDISKWDYLKFETACLKARKGTEKSLIDIMHTRFPDLEESAFVDTVQKNLDKGRFLLTIIGDGIRENMEEIANYIHRNENLNFTLCLVELPVFKNPESGDLLITPRIIVKTREIERVIFRIEDKTTIKVSTNEYEKPVVQGISEKVFYEKLGGVIGEAKLNELKKFVEVLKTELDIVAKPGRGKQISLNLKSEDNINFASIQDNGEVWFYGIVSKTAELNNRKAGVDYLTNLAQAVGGELYTYCTEWNWGIRRNRHHISIDHYLNVKEKWKILIIDTIKAVCVDQIS